MFKNLYIFGISSAAAILYFLLRVMGEGTFEEAVSSAVILGAIFLTIAYANRIERVGDLHKIFFSDFRMWLSLLISIAIGVMAVKNGRGIFLAALDVFFAFSFFTAFFSVISRFRRK